MGIWQELLSLLVLVKQQVYVNIMKATNPYLSKINITVLKTNVQQIPVQANLSGRCKYHESNKSQFVTKSISPF